MRRCSTAISILLLAACSSAPPSTTVFDVDGSTVTTTASGGSLTAPGASVGGGFAMMTIAPAPLPDPSLELIGSWTLARSGDRVCTVELGARNAAGDHTARTSHCRSVDLARIAFWTPGADGLALHDFERRPVVDFRRAGPDLYEGNLADGARVTLWR